MKDLVVIIVKYLKRELANNKLNPDAAEGVEVAVQCLENAYSITPEDVEGCALALEDLYLAASYTAEEGRIVTEEQREEAESLKLLGNKLMKEGRYIEAIGHYSSKKTVPLDEERMNDDPLSLASLPKHPLPSVTSAINFGAIDLDPRNTVYFCNRAAAHIQTQNFLAAINDCHEAIRLDPNYSKAHGRLGYAYQAVGNRVKAKDCYARALDIEPDNESYRNCFQKLVDQGTGNTQPVSELMGLLPGIDLSAIMKNPSFVQMASQMLEDPGMQNAVTRILSGQSSFPAGQVEQLISAGQQLADRLQTRLDAQQQDGNSSEPQSNRPSISTGQGVEATQEPGVGPGNPVTEQGNSGPKVPVTVESPMQTQANIPPSGGDVQYGLPNAKPQNMDGGSVEGTVDPSTSVGQVVQEKNVQGPGDVDMGDGGDSASQMQH